ncbi:MAG: polyhydroxyalkanoate depolymerase [Limnohabitans sp.]
MLYQLYETQRSFMEPFADLAQAAAKLYSNPLNPASQTPLAQRVSAAYALMHRLGKDYVKPEFGIRTVKVDGVDVAIHERVEIDKPFCELRRFKRFSDDPHTLQALKQQPPVLIVAPLSGHYATLLRDTARTMLQDHKVYITDWKNARLVPLSDGEFHLHDYVNYVQEFIRHIQSIYGNCHVMSVCQPTVPVLAAVSLMASRGEKTPLSMTMMGGPIDARKSPTAVNNLAIHKSFEWFENNVIYRVPPNFPGAGRRVYPGFLQHTGFVAMNPDRHANSHYDYFKDLIKGDDASAEAHRKFYDEYNAVLDMDADYYLETIKTVFQEFRLVNGTWDVLGVDGRPERVRPQDIQHTALLTVEGELDDISGSGQTRAAQELCSGIPKNHRQHLEVEGAGHYGIFSGRRWREVVYPLVRQFILDHEQAPAGSKRAAPAKRSTARKTARAAKTTPQAKARPAAKKAWAKSKA